LAEPIRTFLNPALRKDGREEREWETGRPKKRGGKLGRNRWNGKERKGKEKESQWLMPHQR